MSHSVVAVIFPKDMKVDQENLAKIMGPFDENKETPRYMKHTKKELIEKEKKKFEEYLQGDLYQAFCKDPKKYITDCESKNHINYLIFEIPEQKNWSEQRWYDHAIRFYEKENIDEDGNVYSTYNPLSKWDWYRVGGRWDGAMVDNKQTSENGFNFDDMHETFENNSCFVRQIKKDWTPFAIIAPDGKWHEKGEMGWWGIVDNEKEENKWDEEALKIFSAYPDNMVVSVDVHI